MSPFATMSGLKAATAPKKISSFVSAGRYMVLIGVLVCIPLLVIPFYPTDGKYAMSFIIPGLISAAVGMILLLAGHKKPESAWQWYSVSQHAAVTVVLSWTWAIIIGALPFWLSGFLRPVQALFESVSGWTTAGLSVMDVTQTPMIFLFYRSLLQYCGGMGIVLMMVMVISARDSMAQFEAEGHPDKLAPNLRKTARIVMTMMGSLLAAGTIAYMIVGMNFFDAINHAMCALSTGGFSTKLNSIGEYNSIPIEIVTIILMFAGTTNFAVLLLFAKGKWKQFFQMSEIRFLGVLLLIFVPLIAWSLSDYLHVSFLEGLRQSIFNVISALSTTGYGTADYSTWSPFAIGTMILLMLIGGGMGSTAGGMKLTRVLILLKELKQRIVGRFTPSGTVSKLTYTKAQGKVSVDNDTVLDTISFIFCYLLLFIVGSLLLSVFAKASLSEGMFEFASALGTVGLSIGLTGPATSNSVLIVEMIGMMFGRLEIFVIIVGIGAGFQVFFHHRKKKKLASMQA